MKTSRQTTDPVGLVIAAFFVVSVAYIGLERLIAPHTQPGIAGFLGWLIAIGFSLIAVSAWCQRHIPDVRDELSALGYALGIGLIVACGMLLLTYTVFS